MHPAFPRLPRSASLGALCFLVSACATAGSTLRSGVGDTVLERAPYYAGRRVAPDGARVGHFPIAYQRGSTQSPIFDPGGEAGTPIAALLAEMNAYLDSLGTTTRLPTSAPRGTPPDVQFSCETDPTGECARDESRALGRAGTVPMRLAVGRPSASWTEWARAVMDSAGAARALVLTLEVGQYWTHQRGLRGDKEVQLGTNYSVPVPWLTSLETPVTVLQLTGALVDRDGKAVRIGAEGLVARRTRLLVSAVGGQELLSGEDVERLRTSRREDLPGQPLVWQVALRTLVTQLTGG